MASLWTGLNVDRLRRINVTLKTVHVTGIIAPKRLLYFFIVTEECLCYFTLFPFFKNVFAINKSGK